MSGACGKRPAIPMTAMLRASQVDAGSIIARVVGRRAAEPLVDQLDAGAPPVLGRFALGCFAPPWQTVTAPPQASPGWGTETTRPLGCRGPIRSAVDSAPARPAWSAPHGRIHCRLGRARRDLRDSATPS